MSQRNRPILPAEPNSTIRGPDHSSSSRGVPVTSTKLVRRARPVIQACNRCRKQKVKCNGERPVCKTCTSKGLPCSWTVANHQTTVSASRHQAVQVENERLREVYALLQTLPESEARQMFARIRDADDPITVLNFARGSSTLRDPPSPRPEITSTGWNPRVDALSLKTLSESPIRVHAKPWTAVAGDGLVSQLISSFFTWDDAFFYPFIDLQAFLKDMNSGDVKKARYCSPFLVNAICASRCFTSARAKMFSSIAGESVGAQFLDEAKKLLDLESGLASLPTVQGLTLMFTLSAYRGMDRAGMMYRYAAYEMFRRLHLDGTFNKIKDDPGQTRQREIISKAAWGLFCFESIVAYVYLDQSLLAPPTIPRCFHAKDRPSENLDLWGDLHQTERGMPPFVPGILDATCDLSEMLYEIMFCNIRAQEIGSEEDLKKRRELYSSVLEWSGNLPKRMKKDENLTPQTCFLRIYIDELLISLLRPLSPDTIFENGTTAKTHCIQLAGIDADVVAQYIQHFSIRDYSCMALCGLYNSVGTVAAYLDDPAARSTFVKASMMLRQIGRDFPMAIFILQGVQAMAWASGFALPTEASQFFKELGSGKEELLDMPIAFTLPSVASVRQLLSADSGDNSLEMGIEIGLLLSRWSSLSVD
ncbi:putative C6 transcription factor [Fusarium oxysporum]|uniref:Zn(2)-C6 fungal-type domain-containing protein n=1 Tax=Fusarium oxysporum TaxID=5507 RepID=A0A420MQJ9_FUSOX|nr:putative C6 transcription factor [Fusarium oxysporum]RKK70302.1 hypothetical protein BFJ69_g11951 [Fusarium oxysporum]